MEIHETTKEIRKSENSIFRAWLLRMRDAGHTNMESMGRKKFSLIFGRVIAALESIDQEPQLHPCDSTAGGWNLWGENYDSGKSLQFFLAYFKAMICCIDEAVSNMNTAPKQKTAAALKLRKVADDMELAAAAEWENSVVAGNGRHPGALHRPMALSTSEKILSEIFVSVGEGILLVDEDFEIVKANHRACEIYGLLEQNLIGADIRSLTEQSGAQALERFFAELIEGQRMTAEVTSVYVDGKTFPSTITITRSDLDGKRYWPIIVRDDTNWKIMENQLREEKQQTEEMNLTLKTVLKSIEQDRKDFESRIASKIRTSLLPGVDKIGKASEEKVRKSYLMLLEQQLLSLTTGFAKELDAGLLKLTRTEIELCRLIQAGCSSKEICNTMKLSFETVQTHRKNIRKKLDLNGKKLNLHTFLINRVI